MVLEPCLECKHLKVLKCGEGRCEKENQYCVHTNCIREKAIAFFIEHKSRES